MKQMAALQQQARRSNSFRSAPSPLDATVDGAIKSPATIFWLIVHGLCCLISLVLGFRFSRLVFFLLFSTSPYPSANTIYSALQTTLPSSGSGATSPPERNFSGGGAGGSKVVVGRHGIQIRPWPHPDPVEVMKAHRIIERVQTEQKIQYGFKNPRTVIAITPTYVRTFQALHLTGVMHTLMNVPYDLIWIVVEAGGATNETATLIAKSGLKTIHTGFDGRMPLLWEDRHKFESRMRIHALRIVREKRLNGIVMFADDSNMHSLELFDEIQNVRWVGAVSVGIIAYSGVSEEGRLPIVQRDEENDSKVSQLPIQGPACNSSNHLVGWHTFSTLPYAETRARYIGDRAIVLPRKLEWAAFVLNSRLVWEDNVEKPHWVKEWDEFGSDGQDVESPLALLSDTSAVEPLGGCGRKVLLWWLRVEARADSKFPARWTIDPPLDITVPAKRTPWPDAPPELPSTTETATVIPNTTEKRPSKTGSRRKRSRSKRKHSARALDDRASTQRRAADNRK
ncbi:beta-1,4-xylosyltransferase IRX14-like [Andrographis paniculata]|uniref:beta-1,4-xylosyltransferase IRX14-like n=1 Tax=Andrographis paniculata TaxID=175694 RepID=UPI0021E91AFC|nr:beta-1,4-xylosyltransferase IRX14-like [Andrographis paniculata]